MSIPPDRKLSHVVVVRTRLDAHRIQTGSWGTHWLADELQSEVSNAALKAD